jgi:hypothetical protein
VQNGSNQSKSHLDNGYHNQKVAVCELSALNPVAEETQTTNQEKHKQRHCNREKNSLFHGIVHTTLVLGV